MKEIVIEYPNFPEEIQVSAKRRATHFRAGLDVLPKKYIQNNPSALRFADSEVNLGEHYSWKKSKSSEMWLWDNRMKEFVVKNPLSASKPRFITIAGNEIMRMHEGQWQKIVDVLKEFFLTKLGDYTHTETIETNHGNTRKLKKYDPKFKVTGFPLNISIEMHTFPRHGNWDLSNLWIYNKCFEDAAQEAGVIPNDNIRHITLPGAPKFIPVTREDDRKLVFRITEETDHRINGHIMYWSAKFGKKRWPSLRRELDGLSFTPFRLLLGPYGKAGDVFIEDVFTDEKMTQRKVVMSMNPGKYEESILKGLMRVRNQCFQLNMVPEVSLSDFSSYEPHLKKVFLDEGIPLILADQSQTASV